MAKQSRLVLESRILNVSAAEVQVRRAVFRSHLRPTCRCSFKRTDTGSAYAETRCLVRSLFANVPFQMPQTACPEGARVWVLLGPLRSLSLRCHRMAKGSLACVGHHSSGLSDSSNFQIKSRHFFRLKSRPLSATVRAAIAWLVLNPLSPPGAPADPAILLPPGAGCPLAHVLSFPLCLLGQLSRPSFLSSDTRAENTFLPPAPPSLVLASALCYSSIVVFPPATHTAHLPVKSPLFPPRPRTSGSGDQVIVTILGPQFLA